MEIIERNLTVTLALNADVILSGIIVFVEYFNLYMKQLGFNPEPDPEGCHRGLKGLSRSAWLPSLAYFLILDS